MRRSGMVAAAAAFVLVLGACGDDGDGAADLGDDPTVEQCRDAILTVLDRLEIPDGFDPSDGVDDDERAEAEAALEEASEGLVDPNDDDHPCNEKLDEMSEEETLEFLDQLDPEILEFLGSLAEAEFTPIEDEL